MLETMTTPDLMKWVDVLDERDLDRLPLGMIQLAPDGMVLKYNRVEAELAGMDRRDVLGRNFFDEVAPCTKVQAFHGRFLDGVERRDLQAVFDYEFRFRDGRRKDVVITMFYSRTTDSVWVAVQRP
jgi:photoactive yellow protein